MICFVGFSHAPNKLREAANRRGLEMCPEIAEAELVFISQDTPTDEYGNRDLDYIARLIEAVQKKASGVIVLTSQVPPGFTRKMGLDYHMAETLRIRDAEERAYNPEQFIIGSRSGALSMNLVRYFEAFPDAAVHVMSLENAEFAKIAINMTLAKQVMWANELEAKCRKLGNVDYRSIQAVLKADRRIGPDAYLEPGDWRKSPHLLRDWVTFESL